MCERYRISYLGITGYHDASALANNGVLSCAQFMETPQTMSWSTARPDLGTEHVIRPIEHWPDGPRTTEQTQNMPNAYFGAARDGVYAPYKLSTTSQDWVRTSDVRVHGSYNNFIIDGLPAVTLPAGPTIAGYPYGLAGKLYANSVSTADLVHQRSDCGVIQISLENMADSAGFTFYLRTGWEMQPLPGTTFVSFAKPSPKYDPLALQAYFGIARELKDAYPASYNAFGTILNSIAAIASHVLPKALTWIQEKITGKRTYATPAAAVSDSPPVARQAELGVVRPIPQLRSATDLDRDTDRVRKSAHQRPQQQRPKQKKKQQHQQSQKGGHRKK